MSIFSKKTNVPITKPTEFSFETPEESNDNGHTLEKDKTDTVSEKNAVSEKNTQPLLTENAVPNEDLLSIEKIITLFNSLPPVDVTIATTLIKQTLSTVGVDIHKIVQQLKDRISQYDDQESQIQMEMNALQQKLSELTQRLNHSEEEQENLRRILFLLTQNEPQATYAHAHATLIHNT